MLILGALQPGEVRTVIVAWRLDDPAVRDDGRIWMAVPEQAVSTLGTPAGTIVPKGQALAWWRARGTGHEVELPNPVTRGRERLSLERWSGADPERTHVIVAFEHAAQPPQRASDHAATATPTGAVRTPIQLELSDEAEHMRARQAELQREFRDARDRADDRQMRELSPQLQSIADELSRVAFPHYARGWDLSRAIREGTNRFVLDWTTGY